MGLLLRSPLEVIRLSGLSDQSSDANIVQKTVANSVQSDRIFAEIKRLQKLNCLSMITPEVVDVARKGLLLGSS